MSTSTSTFLLYWIIFGTSMFCCSWLSIAARNNETEKLALLEFKARISDDPLGVMSLWNDTHHFCEWYGVTCDRRYGQVTKLDLNSSRITGMLPPHLGNLSYLKELRLDSNNFIGRISDSLGNLKNLTILSLEDNKFYGIVPPSIFNLSLLTHLSLRQNELEGQVPSYLGDTLPNLKNLSLGFNQFTGYIPASISNSSNLEILHLTQNNFQGQVPSLHKLTRLSRLVLTQNNLGYGQNDDLNFISSIANATNLQWLQIGLNNFKGVFPRIICNFSSLVMLGLHKNIISGEIPRCIENLSKLQHFVAYDNKLSGIIPSSIGKLQDLYILYLNGNNFSGIIPPSIGNLTRLSSFSLAHNRLVGQIPSSLVNCSLLTSIYFANNSLSGSIPLQLFSLPSLSIMLDLSENNLTGPLPEEVGQLSNLQTILLNGNMLSGQIPNSLSSCISLEYLYLGKNNFQNSIPDALKSSKGLIELDLSYNNLSGPIPQFLASLQLRLLNLSHNNLEGEVPVGGVFDNATNVLISGNSRLCGGIPEFKLPHCSISLHENRRGNKKKLIVIILSTISGVILLLFLLVLVFPNFFWKRKNTNNSNKEAIQPLSYSENIPNLSYQSLLRATDRFSPKNMIGSGTFGVVYKGIVEEDGSFVAIKIFNLEYHGALKSFVAECEILRSIRHRNLVKVITACSSVDHQGREFKALVSEFMVNGSLESWLHPPQQIVSDIEAFEGTYVTSNYLNFRQRIDIAVDVAFSLDYLHHQCGVPIVHCDLKPSNILLDDELVAHVGDFGLAKILLEGINNKNHAHQSSSIGVRGTIGYAPPEYGLGNEVSTIGDVYSFGILLLEMFTGKRPTNDLFKGGLSLHCYVKKAIPDEITTIVDHTILEDIDKEDEANKSVMFEPLTSILEVALSCSAEAPHGRPNMRDVAEKLTLIRNKFLGIRPRFFYDKGGEFEQVHFLTVETFS